jgi:hypothetical protein
MRSFRELFEMQDKGLRPCRYPRCREYGDVADRQHGIVCRDHQDLERRSQP